MRIIKRLICSCERQLYSPRLADGAEIEVESVTQIELDDITPALARASGFASVAELLKIAQHGRGSNVYLVRFHCTTLDAAAATPPSAARSAARQGDANLHAHRWALDTSGSARSADRVRLLHAYCAVLMCWVVACQAGAGDSPGDAAAYGGDCTPDLACRLEAPASTGDIHQDCVDRINQYRTRCACLEPLARWREAEACADQMATHDRGMRAAHDGFVKKVCAPGGFAQNECPGYSGPTQIVERCLELMWSEGPPPGATCEGSCFQQHGHFINMTSTQYKRVACGFSGAGQSDMWSVQNFSP